MTPGLLASLSPGTLQLASRMARLGSQMDILQKAGITQSTGLVAIDLEAPSKKLYPVLSPLRNITPRYRDGKGGTAVQWRAVTTIAAGKAPWSYQFGVDEGKRNAVAPLTAVNYLASYKGLGIEQSATYESDFAAESFEDIKDLAQLTNLQGLMIGEENAMVGGNTSVALGQATGLTLSTATSGGAIGASATVNVYVVGLTKEGYDAGSVTGGLQIQTTRTNAGGDTTTINGGVGQISSVQTITTGAGSTNSVSASVTPIKGAVAYAWFWGATTGAGSTLGAITYLNSVVITTASGSGTQASNATGLSSDNSQDAQIFDGLISIACGAGPQVGASSSGAYLKTFATGVAGVGTQFTSDGAAGVVEIDAMLKDRWDNYKLGFNKFWVPSDVAQSITRLVVGNNGSPLIRFTGDLKGDITQALGIAGGTFVKSYFNKFTGAMIEIHVHPYMPAGMLLATADQLPYPVNEVGRVFQMRLRRDYYSIDWPQTNRAYPYGTYMDGFLQHYFPPAIGLINNIAPN